MELDEITAIEDRYVDEGQPSLGDAYAALRSRWEDGATDRETCLRLMFLAWYSCSEPGFLTGMRQDSDGPTVFASSFGSLGGEGTDDPEVLFVVGIMASLFPWCCGDEETWASVGARLNERVDELPSSKHVEPEQFEGRGAYGHYFAHMARHRTSGRRQSDW